MEDELDSVGENMKILENSAAKALEREEKLVEKILQLQHKYKAAEARYAESTTYIQTLPIVYTFSIFLGKNSLDRINSYLVIRIFFKLYESRTHPILVVLKSWLSKLFSSK